MPDVAEMLSNAQRRLAEAGVAEYVREARSLLTYAIGRDKAFLFAHPEYRPAEDEAERFEDFIARRSAHEPFQYIVGTQEFYGLDFAVTPDVLIPRPETEMLTERAIELLAGVSAPEICEVGVGSGCILVTILFNVPAAKGAGLDISEKALEIARRNAVKHGVSGRSRFVVSDLFESLADDQFDVIASNPPYVPAAELEGLQAEVRNFEPHLALTDGGDGLTIIRRIVDDAPKHLKAGGHLLMEIGFNQARDVETMFAGDIWDSVSIIPDFQGIPRMVAARLKGR